jgi:predicted  nucleic acid-binding Zn-ribbon protein
MRHPAIEPLLILQDREQTCRNLSQQLHSVPTEVAAVKAKIAAENAAIDAAKTEWRELETKKKMIETEIGSTEDKLAKYRTQQSLVKKNDEFQALGHEIDNAEAAINRMEGEELEVMFEIDASKERFKTTETKLKGEIIDLEARLVSLAERETSLAVELAAAEKIYTTAREPLTDKVLRVYDRIASHQMPVCSPITGGNCSGCHLRVSGEVESIARKDEELATCDQCGRIVWWE